MPDISRHSPNQITAFVAVQDKQFQNTLRWWLRALEDELVTYAQTSQLNKSKTSSTDFPELCRAGSHYRWRLARAPNMSRDSPNQITAFVAVRDKQFQNTLRGWLRVLEDRISDLAAHPLDFRKHD